MSFISPSSFHFPVARKSLFVFVCASVGSLASMSSLSHGKDISTEIEKSGAGGTWTSDILVESASKTTLIWGGTNVTNGNVMILSGEILGQDGGILELKSKTNASQVSTFQISGDSSNSNKFAGKLVLNDALWGGVKLNLAGNKLSEATIDFSPAMGAQQLLTGGRYNVNLTGAASVAGLNGGKNTGIANTSSPLISGNSAGMELSLAGGGVYDYWGEIGSNLSISKTGTGTQTLSGIAAAGTASSKLTVKNGTLEVKNTFDWKGNVDVQNETGTKGALKVSNSWTIGSGKTFTNNGLVEVNGSSASLNISGANVSGSGDYRVDAGSMSIGNKDLGDVYLLNGAELLVQSGATAAGLFISSDSKLQGGSLETAILQFNLTDSFSGTYLTLSNSGALNFTGTSVALNLDGLGNVYTEGNIVTFTLGLNSSNSNISDSSFASEYTSQSAGVWLFKGYDETTGVLSLSYGIPEPATACLSLLGLVVLMGRRRRDR